jgi:Xaa-Pro aminopeptidase
VPEACAARRERLRALVAELELDAALVTSLVNVRYLTGFTGSNGALFVTGDTAVLATDGRYTDQAASQAPDVQLLTDRECAAALLGLAGPPGRRVGFEAHSVTVEAHSELAAAAAASSATLLPMGRPVERLRVVKDEEELTHLRAACAVGDRALSALADQVTVGQTERQVARRLEDLMRDEGADAMSFDTIVAAGPFSAQPHHSPTERPLEAGDLLVLDFGAEVGGYHSDMTRTFVVGRSPAEWQFELYDLVRTAQRAGLRALAPGAPVSEVDAASRSIIAEAGLADAFPHGLGHGVGLQVHEAPLIGATALGTLEAGSPVTVEPGVYLPGRGGVRIEDTLVVRDGRAELLTTSTKELLVLG